MIYWYKLSFHTPVRIGERGIGVSSVSYAIHSTTLHSAIINALIYLGKIDPLKNKSEAIEVARSFKTSSPSPIIGDGVNLFWIKGLDILIKSSLKDVGSIEKYYEITKALRRVRLAQDKFIEEDLTCCKPSILRENDREVIEIKCGNNEYRIISAYLVNHFVEVIVEKELVYNDKIMIAEQKIRAKNIMDRITQAAHPYHLALIKYHTPLLLGIEIMDKSQITYTDIESALRLLGDIGIGGKRTYGFGGFDISKTEVTKNEIETSYYAIQGLFSPAMPVVRQVYEKSIYSVKTHGSKSGFTGITRKPILVLEEGSIIECKNNCRGLVVTDDESFSKIIRSFDPIKLGLRINSIEALPDER